MRLEGRTTVTDSPQPEDYPMPMYRRGLYFNGVSSYMQAIDLQLSVFGSFEVWIYPMNYEGFTLFSVTDNEAIQEGKEDILVLRQELVKQ
jgi:hypothetical protein